MKEVPFLPAAGCCGRSASQLNPAAELSTPFLPVTWTRSTAEARAQHVQATSEVAPADTEAWATGAMPCFAATAVVPLGKRQCGHVSVVAAPTRLLVCLGLFFLAFFFLRAGAVLIFCYILCCTAAAQGSKS